jgi:hypothetical protein
MTWKKLRTLANLNEIVPDTGIELFKTHKTGTVPEKPRRMGSLFESQTWLLKK